MPHLPRLRVAIVAPTLGILGGHAVQAQSMLDGWARDPQVDAWLVPINPLPVRLLRPLLQVKYARTLATQLGYWPLLVREIRRAEVVHVFAASYSGFVLSTLPAVLIARLLHRPVVLNYHSGEARAHLAGSALARHLLRRHIDRLVVPSRFLSGVFAELDLASTIVPNSIDLQAFAYRPRDPLRPRLLSTRNLDAIYNVACTLRAFARIQARRPEATLTIVGTGPDEARLHRLAGTLGLRHVTFAGRVPPPEMPRYYADADIYVQTPSADNMPVSVLEAFASGLPVVSTSVGGVPVLLADGARGLLAGDNDDAAVAACVLDLLDHPDRASARAAAAYDACRAYAWTAVRAQWLDVYHRAASQGVRPPAVRAEAA